MNAEITRTSKFLSLILRHRPGAIGVTLDSGGWVDVDLRLEPVEPPPVLFHGTVEKFLSSIRSNGLLKRSRHHVHLSATVETAESVGSRRGVPVILRVDSARMHEDGYLFYLSENDVWLTDHVPPGYIEP